MRPLGGVQRLPQLVGAAAATSALLGASTLRSEDDGSTLAAVLASTSQMLVPTVWSDQQSRAPPAAVPFDTVDVPSRLKAWLAAQGADVSKLEVRPSKASDNAGFGLFVAPGSKSLSCGGRPWWKPWGAPPPHPTVASFPLSSLICAQNIGADPQVGPMWGALVRGGVLDERGVVLGHLAVERARGRDSPLAPWLDALPADFHSPIMWSAEELQALRGTTLGRAVPALRARLAQQWAAAGPGIKAVAAARASAREPTLQDLTWAHCVFWSRGQSVPVPRQAGSASQLVAADPRGAAALLDVTEALVPGLDFANHATARPPCWWEVEVAPEAPGQQQQASSNRAGSIAGLRPGRVALQLHRGVRVGPGDELLISYSDAKPNEELLMLHGFVEAGAGALALDTVMVAPPVPPQEQWDDVMRARIQLLQSSGLRPQFFLRGADVAVSAGKVRGKGTAEALSAPVPEEALEALEVFVLAPDEVAARLGSIKDAARVRAERRALGAAGPVPSTADAHASLSGVAVDVEGLSSRLASELNALRSAKNMESYSKRRGAMSEGELAAAGQQLGLRMASLSTFVRLLEVSLVGLEDEKEGTGPLESDEAALAAHASGASPLPYRTWCATVYRAGQKRVVRAHLLGARKELEAVIRAAAAAQDLTTGRSRLAAGVVPPIGTAK